MTTNEWAEAFVASVVEVDPTADPAKAEKAIREAFAVPHPRTPLEDEVEGDPYADDLSPEDLQAGADLLELREARNRGVVVMSAHTVFSDDATKVATRDRAVTVDLVLTIAVNRAIDLIRAGGPGEAEYVLTRAGLSAERMLGNEKRAS